MVDLFEEVAAAGRGEELLGIVEWGRGIGAGERFVAEDVAGGEGSDRLAEGADGAGIENAADGAPHRGSGDGRGEGSDRHRLSSLLRSRPHPECRNAVAATIAAFRER
jgi:hypothetical protein